MKNLELKTRYSLEKAERLLKNLPVSDYQELEHLDIYFNVPSGRLKLRYINNQSYELIFYHRENRPDARESSYEIYESNSPEQLQKILSLAYGVKTRVYKFRKVYIYKDCRIHLDRVESSGEFIEFEVVMIPDRTAEEAKKLMDFLVNHFEVNMENLESLSYAELGE